MTTLKELEERTRKSSSVLKAQGEHLKTTEEHIAGAVDTMVSVQEDLEVAISNFQEAIDRIDATFENAPKSDRKKRYNKYDDGGKGSPDKFRSYLKGKSGQLILHDVPKDIMPCYATANHILVLGGWKKSGRGIWRK